GHDRERIAQVVLRIRIAAGAGRPRRLANLGLDRTKRRSRRLTRLARLEPPENHRAEGSDAYGTVAGAQRRFLGNRHEHVERAADVGAEETARRDTDDRDGNAFQREGPPDRRRITLETALPERIADHHHGSGRAAAGTIVRLRQDAAALRANAQHLE